MMEQRCSGNDTSRRDIPSFIEPRPPLIQNPFMRPRPQKGLNLLEQFEEDSEIEETELVQVYLRMKPCDVATHLYEVKSEKTLVTSLDTTTAGHGRRTQHNVPKMYTFSKIFTSECSQKEVFEQVVKDNLKKLPDGHSFTLLTYGASGSGKTYTLMGTVSSPGLVPRSLEYVFKLVDAAQMPTYKPSDNGADLISLTQQEYELQWVKRLRHVSAPLGDKYRRMSAQLQNDLTVSNVDLSNRTKYFVWVSFVEIYNEAIYDLLAPPDKRIKMRIREDASGNVYVKGVTQAFVRSGEEAYDVMAAGKLNLIVAATGIHAHSSRSHCIFTITMLTENGGGVRTSHVRLCDLAGSERQRAARNTGARMQESRAINSSLHVLERCLHMLRRKQKHTKDGPSSMVPYRESKLTRLLGSGLSGSRGEAVSMVVTLNPAPRYAQETKHVLSLAAVAQDIQINNTLFATTLSTLESSTQDTTIGISAEVMKLRSDNERLHFELIQAQARNKELLSCMEESQQQAASTMQELVDETKDMMRQYYEAQIQALKNEMEDMAEEYESRLAETAVTESRLAESVVAENNLAESILQAKPLMPATGLGTPSKYLQNKITQLMTEITVLEDKLSEEKLARARLEKEMQHLRNCIEERDDKAFTETSTEPENQKEIVLTDSDHESDDEPDPFNESLEPVFKKACINKSRVMHSIHEIIESAETTANVEAEVITKQIEESTTENLVNICDSDGDKCSLYATGDDDSEIDDKMVKSAGDTVKKLIQTISDEKDTETDNRADVSDASAMNNSNADKDKSECEELFLESTKIRDEVQNLVPSDSRGTYFVRTDELQEGYLKNDRKIKNVNPVRGTYFVDDPVNKVDENANANEKEVVNKIDKPGKASETLVSKIIKSLKTSQGSDSSLRQFEQLEMAANDINTSKDKSTDLVCLNILKKKRGYFDESFNEISKNRPLLTKPTTPLQAEISDKQTIDKNVAELKYFNNEKDDYVVYKLSSAAKKQEQLLYLDRYENTVETLTIAKIEDKQLSTNDKSFKDQLNLPAAVENPETHLYFNDSDKTSSNDVLISSSSSEKRPHYGNIDTNVVSATNKKVNDVMNHCLKDHERSPSIVADDIEKAYVPSEAIKKLLRESYTKPELISIHKKNAKKHGSVDIFDSPQINIAKSHIIDEINNKPNDRNFEIASNTKAKELSNVEIVCKSIERLVIDQKSKSDSKEHFELEPSIKEPIAKHTQRTKTDLKGAEIDIQNNFKIQVSSAQDLNETQSSKENNTIDEFENICKDLSKVRATEFELLVSDNTLNVKDKENEQEITDTLKVNNDQEMTELTKEFEEVKYSLRSKEKSVNQDDKKIKDVEEIEAESHAKSEFKCKTATKRTLRLRRRKNQDGGSSDNECKLKDIINLKKEFADVTMDLPIIKKEVKDIPSPEKIPGEEENCRPVMGVQSCPMKSVTRSRRKLFTPHAEPLEESLSQVGDSNERLYVPRPSYHRTRARRKL